MKSLITILLFLICTISYSQTTLDTLIFKRVNEYRKSLNVNELKWDETLQKAAAHHSDYLLDVNLKTLKHIQKTDMRAADQYKTELISGHEENTESTSIENYSFVQRAKIYGVIRENVVYFLGDMEIINADVSIVDAWKRSPSHNETLTHPYMKYCGIYTHVFIIKDVGKEFGMDMCNVYIVSTMTFK